MWTAGSLSTLILWFPGSKAAVSTDPSHLTIVSGTMPFLWSSCYIWKLELLLHQLKDLPLTSVGPGCHPRFAISEALAFSSAMRWDKKPCKDNICYTDNNSHRILGLEEIATGHLVHCPAQGRIMLFSKYTAFSLSHVSEALLCCCSPLSFLFPIPPQAFCLIFGCLFFLNLVLQFYILFYYFLFVVFLSCFEMFWISLVPLCFFLSFSVYLTLLFLTTIILLFSFFLLPRSPPTLLHSLHP